MYNLMYIAAGAFFGALCRYGLTLVLPVQKNGFPLSILLINFLGCLFLGWFFTAASRAGSYPPHLRLMIGTGFTGTFTTFSSFTVDTVKLLENGFLGTASLYLAISIAGGLLLSWAGILLGGRIRIPRSGRQP
ncbi:putative fluoride ion transporter CrcB 2 [Paenibacillus albidus]|uniref:Fluoride-specific ion channel FluC n=1 Tax=Paenibacillus albidus TaxID=2041023 RepID=A0A917C937_9BACL|nr:fluoride efflux transporter CrcB [Paenibacillus albidus]GGF79002.1 putative fluoride ion transporter CrcB 2 [Paenibacillus albidus]